MSRSFTILHLLLDREHLPAHLRHIAMQMLADKPIMLKITVTRR